MSANDALDAVLTTPLAPAVKFLRSWLFLAFERSRSTATGSLQFSSY